MRRQQNTVDVQKTFELISKETARVAMARALIKHGNIDDHARAYVIEQYAGKIAAQYQNQS